MTSSGSTSGQSEGAAVRWTKVGGVAPSFPLGLVVAPRGSLVVELTSISPASPGRIRTDDFHGGRIVDAPVHNLERYDMCGYWGIGGKGFALSEDCALYRKWNHLCAFGTP